MICPECKQEMKIKDREVTTTFVKGTYVCMNPKCQIYDVVINWVIDKKVKKDV